MKRCVGYPSTTDPPFATQRGARSGIIDNVLPVRVGSHRCTRLEHRKSVNVDKKILDILMYHREVKKSSAYLLDK
jgi:hypothetical protein